MRNDIFTRKIKDTSLIAGKQITLIIIALLLATIFLAVSGYEPFAIINGVIKSLTEDIAGTIRWAAPLILCGLAICITYKAEVFNLGVDGQLLMGASAATAVGLYMPSSNILLVFIAAMIAGALFALIPALMKVYLDTNEVVSTLLLNFIATLFVDFLVTGAMRDPSSTANLNASANLPESVWLPRLSFLQPSAANVGIYIAVAAACVMAFIFFKTSFGFEIRIVGANSNFAEYGGIKSKTNTLKVMVISGAIAGIVGAMEVTAIQHRLIAGFNPGFGFDGIVVSLLANNNPIGIVFSGLFFGALKNAGINMERITDVPSAVTEIVMAIIIITISAKIVLPKLKKSLAKRNTQKS